MSTSTCKIFCPLDIVEVMIMVCSGAIGCIQNSHFSPQKHSVEANTDDALVLERLCELGQRQEQFDERTATCSVDVETRT